MRRILLLAATLAFALGANAEEYVTEIELLKGEKWWGLDYEDNIGQPIEPFKNTVDTGKRFSEYKNVMVSNAGRYIYSAYPIKVKFDGEKFSINSAHEKVEVQKGGKSLREAVVVCALKNYTPGESPDPEMFALPLYETSPELGYLQGEDEIVGYAEKLLVEGFPPGIIVVCNGWQKINGPYEFDVDLYPDPKRMVDRLHALGFKVMLTISPFIPQWGKVYATALKDNKISSVLESLSTTTDSRNRIRDNTRLAILDLGDDAQFQRIKTGLDKIKAEYGFDGFRFDCADCNDPTYHKKFMENMLSLRDNMTMVQYNNMTYVPYSPYIGNVETNIYRFATKGGRTLFMFSKIITAGLMGYPYMQIALGRRDGLDEKDPTSLTNYMLMQCGMPVMTVNFAPWRITDPKMYENVKAALNFRASLGDYMRKLVADSRRTGEPLVRHMEYQFPNSGFFDCGDQFMLGDKYLFAPCVDEEDKRMVRLPKGMWIDRNGVKIRGPVVKEVDCSEGKLIYFEASR